jgi:hypothetical protein
MRCKLDLWGIPRQTQERERAHRHGGKHITQSPEGGDFTAAEKRKVKLESELKVTAFNCYIILTLP